MDADRLQRSLFRLHQTLYERSGGLVGHRLLGVPSLLLRTTGRRSGLQRTATLVYARDGVAFVVVASNDGQDHEPAWLLNIRADSSVTVQVARRRAPATATVVERDAPDHARLWALVNEVNHDRYDAYQSKTDRPIALVSIAPAKPLA
jgi:deazaflavin-dependent oxidoreductase (nitroreductase family)